MASLPTDAGYVLAEDPEGLALLHEVLHGPAGPAAGRPLPALDQRFPVPPDPDRTARRPPGASAARRRIAVTG